MDAPLAPIEPLVVALRFAAALGLGVMLGLERERTKNELRFAGVRTLGLLGLAGGVAGFLDQSLDRPWLALAVFASIAALVIASYRVSAERGELGITTELSALSAFLLGFLCVRGYVTAAAGLAVASVGVLELKDWLHRLSARIQTADIEATLKFAIVSVIILPLVPNQEYGFPPIAVINPYKIWLMIVLISGINFASYGLVKVVGTEHGIGLTGFLGGLVSSTAVTLGFSQRSREQPGQSPMLALGILVAWTVMFFRIVVLVAAVDVALVPRIGAAMGTLGILSLLFCWVLWRRERTSQTTSMSAGDNPFELATAIRFGLLFAVITVFTKAARHWFGDAGLYIAAGAAGLTDVDPTVLSMAQLALADPGSTEPASRAIVIAVASNTLVKAGMAATLGAPQLRRPIATAGALILAGAALAAWWV